MSWVTQYLLIVALGLGLGASYVWGKVDGAEVATESIARSCAIENRFDADGVFFMCIDEEDYFVPPKKT